MGKKVDGSFTGYFTVKQRGDGKRISGAQTFVAYLGGSAFQTVCDNPVTAYRQLVQQYAKDLAGKAVEPAIASQEDKAVFKANPIGASTSGLAPRLIGVGFKRIPKFGFLLGISLFLSERLFGFFAFDLGISIQVVLWHVGSPCFCWGV